MTRVFVYEHLSGSAPPGADAELMAAGIAMRDAVVGDLLSAGDCAVSVASSPGVPDAPAGARPVRLASSLSAIDGLARQAAAHDLVWVIAPETDGVLAQMHRAVGAARWLGCTADAIGLASSKRATLARAAAHGLLTPLAFAASSDRRWVVKPDDGAGTLATRLHKTLTAARADAAARARRRESSTLEPWVEGEALSVSLLCGAAAIELLSVNRQRIELDADSGAVSFAGVDVAALPRSDARGAALGSWAVALAAAVPGLRGYVGIDLVWHPARGPVLIEINPRVTMAYVGLSAAVGRNIAAAVLAAHVPEPAHAAV